MLFMDKYHILIIQKLIKANALLSSEALAGVLGLTSKTVRKNIELVDQVLKNAGATIVSKPGVGYRLVLEQEDEFNVFLQSFREKYRDCSCVPEYNEERVSFIIHQLLIHDSYIKSEELAEALFISLSTFASELKTVKGILGEYHLQIAHKSGNGLIIKGTEFHKRAAIADYYQIHEENQYCAKANFYFALDSKEVRDELERVLLTNRIHVSLEGLLDLCRYILAAEYRRSLGEEARGRFNAGPLLEEELQAATEIAAAFFDRQKRPKGLEAEIRLLAGAIASRRTFDLTDVFPAKQHQEYYSLSNEIFAELRQRMRVDFLADQELRELFPRELRAMAIRMQMQYEIKKRPFMEAKNSGQAYELAVCAGDFLHRRYGWNISEEELVVLVNAFSLFVEKKKKRKERQRVCMISQYGKGTCQVLLSQIGTYFFDSIDRVDFLEFYELTSENARQWDLVITDIPKSKFAELPVSIYQLQQGFLAENIGRMRYYFFHKDMRIRSFLQSMRETWFAVDLKLRDKRGVFRYAGSLIESEAVSGEDLFAMFEYRENLSSYERGNNTAVVSTLYPAIHRTGIGLLLLKKPIRWKKEIVQVVFLVAGGRDANELLCPYEELSYLVEDINLIGRLLNTKEFGEARRQIGECLQGAGGFL